MVYGVVSERDCNCETTMLFFRGKKISEENIADLYHLGELAKRLQRGDTVYALNVNRFGSVSRLLYFGRFCMQNGISLRFMSQPSLDIANGRHWKDAVIWQMERVKEIETACKGRLQQGFRMTNEQWDFLFYCIECMNMETFAHTFNPDGILKRGN